MPEIPQTIQVNFNTLREEWNTYELENKTIVRVKIFPTSITKTPADKGAIFNVTYSQQTNKSPTQEDRGEPSPDQNIGDPDLLEDVKFKAVFEAVNIYEIPDDRTIVMTRPVLIRVIRTKKFDVNGDRIYRFRVGSTVVFVSQPPRLQGDTEQDSNVSTIHHAP